jgi:hypothetical protein
MSYIYFIKADDRVKIGFSHDPLKRMKELQTGQHRSLRLMGVIEGSLGDEKALHKRFAQYRTRGEWFRLSEEVIGFIECNIGGMITMEKYFCKRVRRDTGSKLRASDLLTDFRAWLKEQNKPPMHSALIIDSMKLWFDIFSIHVEVVDRKAYIHEMRLVA